MSINAASEQLDLGSSIDLYTLDLTVIGYPAVFHWTPSRQDGNSIWFGGVEYLSVAVQITGLERSSQDTPPEPILALENVDKGGYALLKQYNDLVNAKITKIHTWSQFLDFLPDNVTVNPNADPKAVNIPEIWYIEQKEGSDPTVVKWRLSSVVNLQDKMIPARTMLKNVCRRHYRYYDTAKGVFVYDTTPAGCPYAGALMFDRNSNPVTDPTLDRCPKNPRGCVDRYGSRTPLPGWFFPGLQRVAQ